MPVKNGNPKSGGTGRKKAPKTLKRDGDFAMNNLLFALQERQEQYIKDKTEHFDTDADKARIKYSKDALRLAVSPLRMGARPSSIAYAMSSFTIMSLANPDIKKDLPTVVYDMMAPYANTLNRMFPGKFTKFVDKCRAAQNGGRMPYSPETAAMDVIAMDLKNYRDIRDAAKNGTPKEELDAMDAAYKEDQQRIIELAMNDGVELDDFKKAHNRIFVNMVMRYPDAAKCYGMLSPETAAFLKEKTGADFGVPDIKNQVEQTASWYTDDEGIEHTGFSFDIKNSDGLLRDANGENHLYGARRRYEPEEYTEFLKAVMKDYLDDISDNIDQGMSPEHASQSLTIKGLKSRHMTEEIMTLMMDDGLDEMDVTNIRDMVRATYLDERYKTEQARQEAQMGKSSESDSQQSQSDAGDNKSNFDEKSSQINAEAGQKGHEKDVILGQNNGYMSVFDSYGTEFRNYGTYDIQDFKKAGFGGDVDKIDLTLTAKDTAALADCCARLHADIAQNNPDISSGNDATKMYLDLMERDGTAATCRDVLEKSAKMQLSQEGKQISDLIGVCLYTDAPALMKDAEGNTRLISTRTLNGSIKLGEVGAVIEGKSRVFDMCFADASVKLTDSELSAPSGKPLYVGMSSEIRDSKIAGDGVIANTYVKDAEIFGTFDPYATRKELNVSLNLTSRLLIKEDSRDYYGHGRKQTDKISPKYMKSLREFYIEQQQGQREKAMTEAAEKREAERLRKQAASEKESGKDTGPSAEDDIRSRVKAHQGMKQTKTYNDADDIEGAMRRKAASTPGGMDNKRAKGVAEHITREGVNSSQTIESILREADEYMEAADSDSMQMG